MKLANSVSGLKGNMIGQVVTIEDGEFSVTGRLTSIHVWSKPYPAFPGRRELHATVGIEEHTFDVSPFAVATWEED